MNKTAIALFVGLLAACVAAAGSVPSAQAGDAPAPTPPPRKVYLPMAVVSGAPQPAYPPSGSMGMAYVNFYRATAGLPALDEDASWSDGNVLHGRYSSKNDLLTHVEDPENLWYTPAGAAAAQTSNQIGSHDVNASDEWAVATWMRAPFHALGILDPALLRSGFGGYREADGGLQMAAGLDVIRGLGEPPPGLELPIRWPGPGVSVPIGDHWTDTPSPLTSCPGYTAPSGLPVLLIFGGGGSDPVVSGHAFSQGGALLEHCVFTASSYTNPDSGMQSLGRAILSARNAVVLVPRAPLAAGKMYTASIIAGAVTRTWSFSVAAPGAKSARVTAVAESAPTLPTAPAPRR